MRRVGRRVGERGRGVNGHRTGHGNERRENPRAPARGKTGEGVGGLHHRPQAALQPFAGSLPGVVVARVHRTVACNPAAARAPTACCASPSSLAPVASRRVAPASVSVTVHLGLALPGVGVGRVVVRARATGDLAEPVLRRDRTDLDRLEQDVAAWVWVHGWLCP